MKHFLISTLFLFLPVQQATYVFICTGPKSECYHKYRECKGLGRCSREIKKITLQEAKEIYHRRPCSKCIKE